MTPLRLHSSGAIFALRTSVRKVRIHKGRGAAMVIDARQIFRCSHTFVSVTDRGVLQFACASCGYRTEQLALERRPPAVKPPSRRKAARSVRLPPFVTQR